MKSMVVILIAVAVLLMSFQLQAEQIKACQSDYCVDYFNKFKKGSKRGYVQANATIGQFYYIGYGTEKDEDKALKYLNKAARKGEHSAQYLVGVISLMSEENKDVKKGIKYLEKVAKANYKDANYILGTLYINDKIIAKNLEKADLYLAKAYKQKEKRLPELLESISESLEKNASFFPKLTAIMSKKPLAKNADNNLAWPKSHMEVITITSMPLSMAFDEQITTFKRRKKTTGSKLQGKTCDENVGCYQARLNRQSVNTFFMITTSFGYSE
ncbi:MAG: sel1 repeat family protein [Colwellia sp.]|nr:sel1 repeat family protein [Colwellia sp.]